MSSDSLEARIQRLEDLAALQKLMNTYHKTADAFQWAEWAESFTDDSEFEFVGDFGFPTMVGKQVIHDTCKGLMDDVYETMQHVMVNLDFDLTGPDTATGTGNIIFTALTDASKPDKYLMSGGRYKWQYKKTANGWRIHRTTLHFFWNNGADEEAVFAAKDAEAAE